MSDNARLSGTVLGLTGHSFGAATAGWPSRRQPELHSPAVPSACAAEVEATRAACIGRTCNPSIGMTSSMDRVSITRARPVFDSPLCLARAL